MLRQRLLGRAAGASGQQLPCHLPPRPSPGPSVGLWAGCRAGRSQANRGQVCGEASVGRWPFQGRADVWRVRQTGGVTPQSPRAWLGATGSLDPPQWRPPRHPD